MTLLFSGVVNFSTLCEDLDPFGIVSLLNELYTHFDTLLDQLSTQVYKVRNRSFFVPGNFRERHWAKLSLGGEFLLKIYDFYAKLSRTSKNFVKSREFLSIREIIGLLHD